MKLASLLVALLLNAIPVWGVLARGWSIGSLMLLLAFEFLIATFFTIARVWWHERYSGDPVYRVPAKRPQYISNNKVHYHASHTAGLSPWVIVALVFVLMSGLAPIGFARRWPQHEALWLARPDELWLPALAIVVSLAIGFAAELPGLRRRSFAVVHDQVETLRWRAVSLALTIIFGGLVVGKLHSPYAWLAVQLVFKLSVDVWLALRTPPLDVPRTLTLDDRLREMRERHDKRNP